MTESSRKAGFKEGLNGNAFTDDCQQGCDDLLFTKDTDHSVGYREGKRLRGYLGESRRGDSSNSERNSLSSHYYSGPAYTDWGGIFRWWCKFLSFFVPCLLIFCAWFWSTADERAQKRRETRPGLTVLEMSSGQVLSQSSKRIGQWNFDSYIIVNKPFHLNGIRSVKYKCSGRGPREAYPGYNFEWNGNELHFRMNQIGQCENLKILSMKYY